MRSSGERVDRVLDYLDRGHDVEVRAWAAQRVRGEDRNAEPAGLSRDRPLLEPGGPSLGVLLHVADEAAVAAAEIEPAHAVEPAQQALDQLRDPVPLVPADRPFGFGSSNR